MWQGVRVSGFRKPAGIRYPKAYADSGDLAAATPEKKQAQYLFNCAQRAHANYLENQPSLVAALLISGLYYPLVSAALGAGWTVSRVMYAIGYTRKDKTDGSGRLVGMGFWLFQLGLYGLSAWCGIKMLM